MLIGAERDVKQEDTTGSPESRVYKWGQSLPSEIPPHRLLQSFQRMNQGAEHEGVPSRPPSVALLRPRVFGGQTPQRYSMPLQHSHCLATSGVEEAYKYYRQTMHICL